MPDPDLHAHAWRLSAALALARTEGDAAGAVGRAAGLITGADSVRVWLIDHKTGYRFAGAWPEEQSPPGSPPKDLPRVLAFGEPRAGEAARPHRSRLLVPLLRGPRPLGALELLEKKRPDGAFSAEDAGKLAPLLAAADTALTEIRTRRRREDRQLDTVVRLTRLFDIGRTLTAVSEMEEIHKLLVDRTQASLEVDAAYLWLPSESGEGISIAAAAGPCAEEVLEWQLPPGAGVAGSVYESGEPLLIQDPDEIPDAEERPDAKAGMEVLSVAAVPMAGDEGPVQGVIEIINREGEDPEIDEDVLAFLEEIARMGVVALGNARRLEAERRAGDLGSLLETTQALGSSLDIGKIVYTLVHLSAKVIPFERASVGLYKGTKLELAGVSGQTIIDEKQPVMKKLHEILTWAAGLDAGCYTVMEEDGTIDTARPEIGEMMRAHFEIAGTRTFLTVPLHDEEGRLGVFALEGTAPYAFSARELEAAELLAAQATMAIRNATLFNQIPLVNVFQPWARRKQRFLSKTRAKRAAWIAGAALAAALLFLVPVPLRVGGEARVIPEVRRPVVAEVEGRVTRVLVREGDDVHEGQVIALLDDADYRAGEEDARSRYDVARREESRLRAGGEPAVAAVESARLRGLEAELKLWQTRLERTRVRTAVSGRIATPRVEDLAGRRLEKGDLFCEVVDPSRQLVEVSVPESDAGLVEPGMPVKLKLRAFPVASYAAVVDLVGVAAHLTDDGERVFNVRARLDEMPEGLRSGMTGEAKISTGPASIARVVLRRPARWIWEIVWGWLP